MDKQSFAKIGVFVLLGLNVGAYYVFWPHQGDGAKNEAKPQKEEKGETRLMPATPTSGKPKEIAPASVSDAVPLSIPTPPNLDAKDLTPDEAVNKLLEHIKRESEAVKKPATDPGPSIVLPPAIPNPFDEKKLAIPGKPDEMPKPKDFPAAPMFPEPGKLPPLKGDPVMGEANDPNVGITSAITPKVPPGPWVLQTEKAGNATLLIAKLQGSLGVTEFRIVCDRIETNKDSSEVVALGSVALHGAGLHVDCRRLTLTLADARLIFEDNVVISQPSAAGTLRGERFVWEPAGTAGVSPAALGPPK